MNTAEILDAAGWQPIETAPRDAYLLLYGKLVVLENNRALYSNLDLATRATGYWCSVDEAWSIIGGTWEGPWIDPTHWQPLPSPPRQAAIVARGDGG